jgi:hypothetical protein
MPGPVSEGPKTYRFTRYKRVVLPVDGFVFWVRADLVSTPSVPNIFGPDEVGVNDPPRITAEAATREFQGAVHYETEVRQEEDSNSAVNRVNFTSYVEIDDLNRVAPDTMLIGEFRGLKYGFNTRGTWFEPAKLYHYVGHAVYPWMASQIIDDPAQLMGLQVVSNSLPIWMALNTSVPVYGFKTGVILYPSYLAPENIVPPFGSVHIADDGTETIQVAPVINPVDSTHWQLCKDHVRITLYGANNDAVMNFVDAVNQYSLDRDVIGMMEIGAVCDAKRTQSEFTTIAQKKVIEYDVSYYQAQARHIGRQLIRSAIPTYSFR